MYAGFAYFFNVFIYKLIILLLCLSKNSLKTKWRSFLTEKKTFGANNKPRTLIRFGLWLEKKK